MKTIEYELKNAWIRQLREDWRYVNYQYFQSAMKMPIIDLFHSYTLLGKWQGGRQRTLSLSEVLIEHHPWQYVKEVLQHEMAHQYVEEILGIREEGPHGEAFKKVCAEHAFDSRAAGDIAEWIKRKNSHDADSDNQKMLNKIQKLLSLAQSAHLHEAELAMAKAQELLLKHNLSLLELETSRDYISRQIGEVGRKNPIKTMLTSIIIKFFFVEAIWTFGYDQHLNKSGKILEIYGTRENVDMAEYVHHFLLNTAEKLWLDFKRSQKIRGNKKRRTYIMGLLNGFREKLGTASEALRAENLVWLGDTSLKDYWKKKNPKVRYTSSSYSRVCQETYQAGKNQGKTLIIHKGITSTGQNIVHLLK